MGTGIIIEPLVVVILLFGGTWINRATGASSRRLIEYDGHRSREWSSRSNSQDFLEAGLSEPTAEDGLLRGQGQYVSPPSLGDEDGRRKRLISIFGSTFKITSPNASVFHNNLLSRLLRNFPFLMECWYWAVIYWTYQGGRAITALTLQQNSVDIARKHALQLVWIEKKLGIFWEVQIQQFFLQHSWLMTGTNWVYSFIHIPGSIAFLVWLYYYTVTRNRQNGLPVKPNGAPAVSSPAGVGVGVGIGAGPLLYEARRRALAVCNLLAFVVFTLWPCMPPRLLSDKNVDGPDGELGRSYGFVDTVHGVQGSGSVWTENRFCNQYAAMPSLHFGYSLIIGFTIMGIPFSPRQRRAMARSRFSRVLRIPIPSFRRLICVLTGFAYPFVILAAIVATANHFILDAIAGAVVCAVGWRYNGVLLNLLPLEDYFLWAIRTSKPTMIADLLEDDDNAEDNEDTRGCVLD